jgi:mRNA interferase RelE/StbE
MPDYKLSVEHTAVKALDELHPKHLRQIMRRLFGLQKDPFPHDSGVLKGYPGGYRLDQGEYRVLYTVESDVVRIFRVGKRNDGDVYRNLH